MHVFTTTAAGALATLSLVQFSPAPPAVIGAVAGGLGGGAISGGIVVGTKNHRRALPPVVSEGSRGQCTQQINSQGGTVNIYSTGDDYFADTLLQRDLQSRLNDTRALVKWNDGNITLERRAFVRRIANGNSFNGVDAGGSAYGNTPNEARRRR